MPDSEVLVALLRDKKDFAILQSEGWYRIPVKRTPQRWPPEYIAFYQPRAFGEDAFCIRYYGKIARITQATRRELFPNELESENSDKLYYRIQIETIEEHVKPIPARLARRVVFIPTTWRKFLYASELNDLFDDSPLEDILWEELKRRDIQAERQWPVVMGTIKYQLDFAFFCKQGKLDVETDGDSWHKDLSRIASDNRRNNDVESLGWHVLRFNTNQVEEQCSEYCIPRILDTLNTLGGLVGDGMVPRKFIDKGSESAQQLSLFEQSSIYITDQDEEELED